MKKPARAAAKPVPKKAPPKKAVPKKPAKHVVPPKISPAAAAKAKKARHVAAVKAAKTRAANLAKAKLHKRVQLALGEGVACCAAEALAASLRLAGWPVTDADVLALYWRTARDEDEGATILATLEAAARYGVAGYVVASFRPADLEEVMPCALGPASADFSGNRATRAGLILGVDLPGPHAVLDTGSEWITWGQAWPAWAFPDAAIEEAWEVTWPDTR